MEASTNHFKYENLDSAAGDIRLLILEPNTEFSAQISVHIFKASLEDPPPYEALSYMWGDARITSPIRLNGQIFAVTVNLEAALHHLRWKDGPRTLWVDAISIDQHNTEERGQQVARMRDNYRHAVGGLLWLGVDPGLHISTLQLLKMKLPENFDEATAAVYSIINRQTKSQYKETLKELRKVFDDPPVWTRMWIVQEISIVQGLKITLGSHSFEWATAEAIIEATRLQWHKFGSFGYDYIPLGTLTSDALFEERKNYQNGMLLPFYMLWNNLAGRSCTDVRDNVFALLGLSQDLFEIIPTYHESSRILFNTITRHCISRNQNLDILTICGPSSSSLEIMPSWIPNFAASDDVYHLATGGAFLNYTAGISSNEPTRMKIYESPDEKVLIVGGVMLGSVSNMIGPPNMELHWDFVTTKTILNGMLVQLDELEVINPPIQRENLIDGFWRTITLDLYYDFIDNNEIRRLTSDDIKCLRRAFYELAELPSNTLSKPTVIQNLKKYLNPRRKAKEKQESVSKLVENIKMAAMQFCLTSSGSMAMVTDKVQIGDWLCILWGSRVPHVLRPVPELEDAFQIVGIGYVHDFMDGQALDPSRPGVGMERIFNLV